MYNQVFYCFPAFFAFALRDVYPSYFDSEREVQEAYSPVRVWMRRSSELSPDPGVSAIPVW